MGRHWLTTYGIRVLDYNTEREVGIAIKESGIAREGLFVTTKVRHGVYNLPEAIKTSLEKLQLDYVDLYIFHTPFYFKKLEDISPAWAIMEDLKAKGLARAIGLSNFRPKDLEAVLRTCKIRPALNQIEFHPYRQRPKVRNLMQEQGILPIAYGALVPLRKKTDGPVNGLIQRLAVKYGVGSPEILMRWQLDKGMGGLVTTSSREEHLENYKRVGQFKLTAEEVVEIDHLGSQVFFKQYWPGFEAEELE